MIPKTSRKKSGASKANSTMFWPARVWRKRRYTALPDHSHRHGAANLDAFRDARELDERFEVVAHGDGDALVAVGIAARSRDDLRRLPEDARRLAQRDRKSTRL